MKLRSILLAATLGLAAASGARAAPGYYVVGVYDEQGVAAAELRYWTVHRPGAPATLWPELGLSYGVNSRWTTALLASWIGTQASATQLSSLNWTNDVLLTQGERPFDLAVHSALERVYGYDAGWALEAGPALQTDLGRTRLNANLVFERVFGDDAGATQLKYQWQLLQRATAGFGLGVQGFGELGPWDHWAPHAQQSHRAGPVLAGSLPPGGSGRLSWQAACLFGTVYGRHGDMFSLRVRATF